ncbi:phage tail domain-containing protein [Kitasatospora sp. MBT66]|uniref:phage tail domain-containing protein n=1 Tax=Kitasatospora sp. MBT66 TaxID=1444769 RepID=UPI0005BC8614|nr:phage tail domain-containing protein [Kitasatospora sp. MBT66]
MPIPATTPTVKDQQPAPLPLPPQPMAWGHTHVTITGSNGQGEEIPLTSFASREWPVVLIQAGATGLDMPPVELHSDASPNLHGSIYRGARIAERQFMIPVYLHGVDRRTLKDLKRRLISALNPMNGYCVLRFTEGDSLTHTLYAYYRDGMQGDEGVDNAGFRFMKFGLQFTAFDPFYHGQDTQVAEWQFGDGKAFLKTGKGLFPLALNKGLLSSEAIPVVNPGSVEAWPMWELKGPVRGFKMTGPAGTSFGIAAGPVGSPDAVPAGRTLIIDSRPGIKTLKDDQGTNYWPRVDAAPALWSVPAGKSAVSVDLVAAGAGASLRLSFRPRFESY